MVHDSKQITERWTGVIFIWRILRRLALTRRGPMVSWMIGSVLAYDFLKGADKISHYGPCLAPKTVKYCHEFIPIVVQFFNAEAFGTMRDAQFSKGLFYSRAREIHP